VAAPVEWPVEGHMTNHCRQAQADIADQQKALVIGISDCCKEAHIGVDVDGQGKFVVEEHDLDRCVELLDDMASYWAYADSIAGRREFVYHTWVACKRRHLYPLIKKYMQNLNNLEKLLLIS
jgi:hypothetical protein